MQTTVVPSREFLREAFMLVSEAVPDAILEIRYASSYNFVGSPIDGYEQPCAILTQQAADALRKVSDAARTRGYRLKIYDAYRPVRAVAHFARWAEQAEAVEMQEVFYPGVDKANLFSLGYIARQSGHSRGSTVDLTLVEERTGKEVDMGGAFDFFGERSHTDYTSTLTPAQIAGRLLLRDLLCMHSFLPLKSEWWHFTLQNEPFPDTYFDFPVNPVPWMCGREDA